MDEIYPLTITLDRYGGTYSKGLYLAWNLYVWEIPKAPFLDDVTCMNYWRSNENRKEAVGLGDTPESAVKDLEEKLTRCWAEA